MNSAVEFVTRKQKPNQSSQKLYICEQQFNTKLNMRQVLKKKQQSVYANM